MARKSRQPRVAAADRPAAVASASPWYASDRGVALLLACVACLTFAASLRGEFVYDDRRQILENHLIRDPARLMTALGSDVWAFKGERGEAWSSYWRPTFVAWLALNQRLFGTASTLGWHLGNLALHGLSTVLGFWLARRLGLATALAGAAALIFAVHPAHVESVAWISGSPDLLMAVALLGALLLLCRESRPSALHWVAILSLGGLGLLAKEAAVVIPVLAFALLLAQGRSAREALARCWPLGLLAALYLMTRTRVLGVFALATPWAMGPGDLLASLPAVIVFYLRQTLLPFWFGPSYPLRGLATSALDAAHFWGPLVVLAIATVAAVGLARRRPVVTGGLALFCLPLLPALNLNAFIPEQLVHDRYLYLPLLGMAIALLAACQARPRQALVVSLAVSLPLALQTIDYTQAWTSELGLWERGVRSDPGSSFNWAQYGEALAQRGRDAEARQALDRALALRPVTSAYLTRARLARREGRLDDAARDLQTVLAAQQDNAMAYEQLALVYQQAGRLKEAAQTLETGAREVPYKRCAFSVSQAVALYLDHQREAALAKLQLARAWVAGEPSAACQMGLFHLGVLSGQIGALADARAALEQYLQVSALETSADTLRHRKLAAETLAKLR